MKKQLPPYVHAWPAPVVLVGCGSVPRPNLITISWFGVVCSIPPMVSIAVRPTRFSFKLIQESGEFTVNLPIASQLSAAKLCGEKSGRDLDKVQSLGWTPAPCPPLDQAPMIQECFLSLGCRVKQELPLGTHHLFISEVVVVYADESNIRREGRADPVPESQIVWVDKKYFSLHPLE